MTSWEEYNKFNYAVGQYDSNSIQTTIKCPNCGQPIYMRTDIVLTSYPAQYQYYCNCGWIGTSHNKWGI